MKQYEFWEHHLSLQIPVMIWSNKSKNVPSSHYENRSTSVVIIDLCEDDDNSTEVNGGNSLVIDLNELPK